MYHFYRPVYGVYTQRFVDAVKDADTVTLAKWFDSKEAVYVVTTEKEYIKIKDSFLRPIHVVIRRWIDHRYILLISNRPASETNENPPPLFTVSGGRLPESMPPCN